MDHALDLKKIHVSKSLKVIRVLTIAPIVSLITLIILYMGNPLIFGGIKNLLFATLFLTVLPISAYPLQPILPGFKNGGRTSQRNLAIIMAVLGYVASIAYAAIAKVPNELWIVFLSYFFSGLGILLFNKILKIRASGHASGITGLVTLPFYFFGSIALLGLIPLTIVYWSSIKTKRHTFMQLIWGSVISILALVISAIIK